MLDWLGLSPAMTQVFGIALIVIGASILLCLGLYFLGKHKATQGNAEAKKIKVSKEKPKNQTIAQEKDEQPVKAESEKPIDVKEPIDADVRPEEVKEEPQKKSTEKAGKQKQPATKSTTSVKNKITPAPAAVKKAHQTKKTNSNTKKTNRKKKSSNNKKK